MTSWFAWAALLASNASPKQLRSAGMWAGLENAGRPFPRARVLGSPHGISLHGPLGSKRLHCPQHGSRLPRLALLGGRKQRLTVSL